MPAWTDSARADAAKDTQNRPVGSSVQPCDKPTYDTLMEPLPPWEGELSAEYEGGTESDSEETGGAPAVTQSLDGEDTLQGLRDEDDASDESEGDESGGTSPGGGPAAKPTPATAEVDEADEAEAEESDNA